MNRHCYDDYDDKLWEELKEICNYDLEEIKNALDYLVTKYEDEKYYQENKKDLDQAELDDRKYKEMREMEN